MDTFEPTEYTDSPKEYTGLTRDDVYKAVLDLQGVMERSSTGELMREPYKPWLAPDPSPLWDDYVRRGGATTVTIPGLGEYRWGDWSVPEYPGPYREEDKPKMNWVEYVDEKKGSYKDLHAVVRCEYPPDLEQDRIMKTISIMKSEMMMKCAPHRIDRIECRMTPSVRHNLIMAYRRLNRYGKKTPFVARFDEYGRRLEDEIRIDTLHGMIIRIVDPVAYGLHYIEFEGIRRDV